MSDVHSLWTNVVLRWCGESTGARKYCIMPENMPTLDIPGAELRGSSPAWERCSGLTGGKCSLHLSSHQLFASQEFSEIRDTQDNNSGSEESSQWLELDQIYQCLVTGEFLRRLARQKFPELTMAVLCVSWLSHGPEITKPATFGMTRNLGKFISVQQLQ